MARASHIFSGVADIFREQPRMKWVEVVRTLSTFNSNDNELLNYQVSTSAISLRC